MHIKFVEIIFPKVYNYINTIWDVVSMSRDKIDRSKCVGCNLRLFACLVNDANISHYDENSRVIVKIEDKRCIKCGKCIRECFHKAKYYTYNTSSFFKEIGTGERFGLLVVPSIKFVFGNSW